MQMTRTKCFGIAYITVWVMLFIYFLFNYMSKKGSIIGQDDVIVFVVFPSIFWSIWLLVGLFKLLSKKDRPSSLPNMILLLFFTAIFIIIFSQFTQIVLNSRAYSDAERVRNIRTSIDLAIDDSLAEDPDWSDNNEYYQMLLNGCDITTWGAPSDSFTDNLAARLGIRDFSELKYKYYTVHNPAVVYASIEDGKASVTLQDLP